MTNFFTDTSTPFKKFILSAIIGLLWLLMLVLGAVAIDAAHEIAEFIYLLNVSSIESKVQASGLFTSLQIVFFIFGGLILLILAIGGTHFFKYIGETRSIKFFGSVILIEALIIIASLLI